MLLKTYQFEAIFTPILNTDDFELEITFDKYPLKIKGLSKKLLIEKQSSLSGEHAIYILEGPSSCYVGQSKDVQSRIKNHTGKNKADFHRCFVLSSSNKDTDWRVYLDYMESYAIKEMEYLGYSLENTKKPNPEDDILKKTKKETANEWINIFLSFLPILGFKKSPNKISNSKDVNLQKIGNLNNLKQNNSKKKSTPTTIRVYLNNELFADNKTSAIQNFIKVIEKIGVHEIYQKHHLGEVIFNKSLIIFNDNKKDKFNQSTTIHKLNKGDFFLYECSSTDRKIKMLNKIESIFKLGFKFEKVFKSR